MSPLSEELDRSTPDEVLIDWAFQIAQLEQENTSLLVRLMEGGFDEEGYFHVSPTDWMTIRSYGWLERLSRQESLLGKSKMRPDVVWLLEQTVEVRVILHPPVPEKHSLFGRYSQALKTRCAHERGAMSEHLL